MNTQQTTQADFDKVLTAIMFLREKPQPAPRPYPEVKTLATLNQHLKEIQKPK